MTPPRLLPQDEEAERAVLCAILLSGRALDAVGLILRPDDFALIRHQIIFSAMLALGALEQEIDYLVLCDTLKTSGTLAHAGGLSYLAELTQAQPSAAQVVKHAGIVKELAVRRRMIRLLTDSLDQCYEGAKSQDVGAALQTELFGLLWGQESRSWKVANDVIAESVEFCQIMESGENRQLLGIASGLIDLDQMLGGFRRGELAIIGGRPSMGKTSLALLIAVTAALNNCKAGILSLEMTTLQLGLRLIAMQATEGTAQALAALRRGIPQGAANCWRIVEVATGLSALPIYVDDSAIVTMPALRAKARQLQMTSGLDVLIVDYLQLMDLGDEHNRREGLEAITRGLKILAKELNIAVIALSQLSRLCEGREDKRPMLSDLREAGGIEQDADVVAMVYRDEFYYKNSDRPGEAEILLRKNRDGATGDVRVAWLKENATFANLAPQAYHG